MRVKIATAIGVACVAVLAIAPAVSALTLHGTVVNGTTEKPVDGKVIVVNPAGGMMTEEQVQTQGGSFTVEDLDPEVDLYLLRFDYAGVMYTQPVQAGGQQTVHATITVYDTTTSWEGVHVLMPHLAAAATDGVLQVEALYEIHNHADPPATIADIDHQFVMYMPEDRIEILRSFVSHDEVPLDRFPVPTDEAGIYRVDYPIRPGETQVGLAYTVPYGDSTYTMSFTLPYPIEEMTVYAINDGMTVTSRTLTLGKSEAVHGMTAYALSDIPANTKIDLTFSGGGALPATAMGENPGGQGDQASTGTGAVISIPNRMENPSILLMVGVMLAMLAVIGFATRGTTSPIDKPERLNAYYQLLLKRLARLDDLNEAGAVAHDVYKAKRTELKNQLASLQYRMQAKKKSSKRRSRHREPSVSGKERTAP